MGSQLTDLIRKKYPGHYDDMSDEDLEKSVLEKHPEYKDLATPTTQSHKEFIQEGMKNRPLYSDEDIASEGRIKTKPAAPIEPEQEITPDFKSEVNATTDSPASGWLSKGYHALTDPLTDAPSRFGKSISDYITTPSAHEDESPNLAMLKGAIGGSLEGLGNVVSGFTSPLSLATMGMGGIEGVAGKAGLESIAAAMNTGQKVAAIPMIGHGGYEMLRPDATMGERGQGLAELAGGFAAGMHDPIAKTPETINPALTAGLNGVDKADIPLNFLREHAPVGEEGELAQTGRPQFKNMEDFQFNLAREKQNMGMDMPTDMPVPTDEWGHKEGDPVGSTPQEGDFQNLQSRESTSLTPDEIADRGAENQAIAELNKMKESYGEDSVEYEQARNELEDIMRSSNAKPVGSGNSNEMRGRIGSEEPVSEVADMAEKPKGVLGNNVNIILKSEKATPETIKKAMEAGYELIGHNDNGDFRFRKTDKPIDTPILEGELPPGKRLPLGPKTDVKEGRSILGEVANFPRTMMATMDMSAPLRQGFGLIHKPAFWKSLGPMVKSFGSEKVFQATMDSIAERPLFKSSVDQAGNYIPSFAEKSGLKLTDLGDISKREEAMMSQLAEKWVPGVRASERAYTVFLNKLRADTFESLVKDGKVLGIDGETNTPLAKSLADFVNTATGRGSLGKLESSANALNQTFFAPRLIASRLHMMDPRNYVTGSPQVRKEYLKSLLAMTAVGNTVGQVAKLAGAEVSGEPTSSDFGKIKIGKTRIDPFAGFQQYAVLASRLLENKTTSSTTGKSYELGGKFGRQTRFDVAERFAESKLSPILSLATAFMHGKDFAGNKFNLPEEVATRFVPLFVQDMKNLLTEDPNITSGYDKELHPENLPLALPGWFGMGTQLYGDRTRATRQ